MGPWARLLALGAVAGTALAVVCGVRAAKGHGRQDLSHVSWRTCVADLLTDHRTVVLRGVPS